MCFTGQHGEFMGPRWKPQVYILPRAGKREEDCPMARLQGNVGDLRGGVGEEVGQEPMGTSGDVLRHT